VWCFSARRVDHGFGVGTAKALRSRRRVGQAVASTACGGTVWSFGEPLSLAMTSLSVEDRVTSYKKVLVMGAGLPFVLKLCFLTFLVNLIAEKKGLT
jgi:hypothetical protein